MKAVSILIILLSSAVNAKEWYQKVFYKDNNYHYYVGVSDEKRSLKEAMNDAYLNAINEAIRHNFGVKSNISQNYSSNIRENNYTESINLEYENINLIDIEPVKEKVVMVGDNFQVYRKIKYSIKAIEKEKKRLKVQSKNVQNIYGNSNLNGAIEITTNPTNAKITLTSLTKNYQISGSSNALFRIPIDKYNLTINKDGYENISKEIVVSGKKSKINEYLKESTGTLIIHTNPKDATIIINNKIIKKNNHPTKMILKANQEHKIRVEHPDYFSKSEINTTWSNEKKHLYINLKGKSSFLSINTLPKNASVYIDDVLVGTSPIENYQLKQFNYKLRIEKQGFKIFENEYTVAPNRTIPPMQINLKKEEILQKNKSNNKNDRSHNNDKENQNNFIERFFNVTYDPLIINKKLSFTFVPLGFNLFFKKYLSVGLDWRYHQISQKESNIDYKTITSHTMINSKVYLIKNKFFYIGIGLEYHNLVIKHGPWSHTYKDFKSYDLTKDNDLGGISTLGVNISRNKSFDTNLILNYRSFKLNNIREKKLSIGLSFEF